MKSLLFICNTAPFDGERVYNALRLALQAPKQEDVNVKIFLQSEAVYAAIKGQNPPHLKYKMDEMLTKLVEAGAEIGLCGVCMDTRSLTEDMVIDGVKRSTMAELADWTLNSDKVLVF